MSLQLSTQQTLIRLKGIVGDAVEYFRPSAIFHQQSDVSVSDTKCRYGLFLETPRTQGFLLQRKTQKPHAHTHRRTCTPSRHPFELPLGWLTRGLMWLTTTSVSVFAQIPPSQPHGTWSVEKLRLAESSQSFLHSHDFSCGCWHNKRSQLSLLKQYS